MARVTHPRCLPAGVALLLLIAASSRGAEPPNLSGTWKLNHEQSSNAEEVIKAAAGAAYMQGRPEMASETILPWGRKFSEGNRVLLREALLEAVQKLDTLELEQSPTEFKTIHGDAGVRIFHLDRKSSGTALLTGETLKRRAFWKDGALTLDSESGKTKTKEVFTLDPTSKQLVHHLHVDMDLLKHDIDLKLVYDRAPVP